MQSAPCQWQADCVTVRGGVLCKWQDMEPAVSVLRCICLGIIRTCAVIASQSEFWMGRTAAVPWRSPKQVLRYAVCPNLESQKRDVSVAYINSCTGLQLTAEQIAGLLSRMALTAQAAPSGDAVHVEVPPSRSDILHDCDVMEVWPAPSPAQSSLQYRLIGIKVA